MILGMAPALKGEGCSISEHALWEAIGATLLHTFLTQRVSFSIGTDKCILYWSNNM